LDRRDVDLAIPHRRVAVADFEQRALGPHRNEQRRAGDQFLIVEIARPNAWRSTVYTTERSRRREPDAAEERVQRNVDARGEMPDHPHRVELDDLRLRLARKILGQKAAPWPKRIASVVDRRLDRAKANFEYIA